VRDLFEPTRGEEVVGVGPLRALRWTATELRAPTTFLLIHGLWDGAHVWRRMGPYLARRGYTSYAVWQRHHHPGADPLQLRGLDIYAYVRDIVAAVASIGRPVLVGHSVGGLIALAVATRCRVPGVAVLSCAAPRGIPTLHRGSFNFAALPHFVPLPFRRGLFLAEFGYVRTVYYSHLADDEARRLYAGLIPEPWRVGVQAAFWPPRVRRRDIKAPILVASGGEDCAIIPWVAHRIARRFRVVPAIYPGRGHLLPIEPGWESVADDLLRWADRLVE